MSMQREHSTGDHGVWQCMRPPCVEGLCLELGLPGLLLHMVAIPDAPARAAHAQHNESGNCCRQDGRSCCGAARDYSNVGTAARCLTRRLRGRRDACREQLDRVHCHTPLPQRGLQQHKGAIVNHPPGTLAVHNHTHYCKGHAKCLAEKCALKLLGPEQAPHR